jgi:alpha-beta hydrolase superfamily lysophospholipase
MRRPRSSPWAVKYSSRQPPGVLHPAKHRITYPRLLLHGGHDPLARYEDQEPFLRAPAAATVRIWPDGEHTLHNHSAERDALTRDGWFTDRLTGQNTPKG